MYWVILAIPIVASIVETSLSHTRVSESVMQQKALCNFNEVTITLALKATMRGTDRSPGMISLAAAQRQVIRDLERAYARTAQLEEKNALLQGNLDAAVASSDEKMLRICILEEKLVHLQRSSHETKSLKEDTVVRDALEKEMQRLYRQSTDLKDSHKEELDGLKAQHVKELNEVADQHTQELKQLEDYHTRKEKQTEDRLQPMESSLRANRAALNSKETTLRYKHYRRQLGRSLLEVEELRAKAVAMKKRYKDDFDLWLDSMNEVLAAAPTTHSTRELFRPATA
ncbi:hypothetical protein GQ600_12264 [Phytophthora cactorum]|nr:hypothetical protein GQ600_12264 [Phytophthora cactorum]